MPPMFTLTLHADRSPGESSQWLGQTRHFVLPPFFSYKAASVDHFHGLAGASFLNMAPSAMLLCLKNDPKAEQAAAPDMPAINSRRFILGVRCARSMQRYGIKIGFLPQQGSVLLRLRQKGEREESQTQGRPWRRQSGQRHRAAQRGPGGLSVLRRIGILPGTPG